MLPLQPPYNRLHFISILLSPNFCAFSDMEPFLHLYPILSALLNLNFLTWRTLKFKVPKILPGTLSPTQIELKEPKRSKINPHHNYETAVHILLEDPAYRWFDFACSDFARFFQRLPNLATSSPKKWVVQSVYEAKQDFENVFTQFDFQFHTNACVVNAVVLLNVQSTAKDMLNCCLHHWIIHNWPQSQDRVPCIKRPHQNWITDAYFLGYISSKVPVTYQRISSRLHRISKFLGPTSPCKCSMFWSTCQFHTWRSHCISRTR